MSSLEGHKGHEGFRELMIVVAELARVPYDDLHSLTLKPRKTKHFRKIIDSVVGVVSVVRDKLIVSV